MGDRELSGDDVTESEWEAIKFRTWWGVRPKGQLGTCGFSPFPWTVIYVGRASDASDALRQAASQIVMQRLRG